MDPNHANHDAAYAADWRLNESARKARNSAKRAAALAHARQWIQDMGTDAVKRLPTPQEPDDGGDELYTDHEPKGGTREKGKEVATENDEDEDDHDPPGGWLGRGR